MSTPSNLYADKLLSEHPLALWSLDTGAEYVSLISEANRDLSGWTATSATLASVSDSTAPFSSSYITQITGTATPVYGDSAELYLVSPFTFSSTSSGFTVGFSLKTSNRAFLDVGYGSGKIATISTITRTSTYLEYTCTGNHNLVAGEYVTVTGTSAGGESIYNAEGAVSATGLTATVFRLDVTRSDFGAGSGGTVIGAKFFTTTTDINPINYLFNSWIPLSFSSEDVVSSSKLVFRIGYYDTSPIYYINGLTLGQDSQKFNGESFGQTLSSLPATISTTLTNGIETKSYGDETYSAYYIGSGNELYAKNTSIPMSYGSLNIMTISPNATANQPSFIFPGFGFLNEVGRYKELTVEFLARINVNSSTPKKIFGPLASTDGLYVTNEYVTLKIGDYIKSYYVSELFKPILYQIQIGNGFANLSLDGDTIISMSIDNESLSLPAKLDGSSKSQDWLGFYAYTTSVPSIDVDSVAIYPYKVSETAAKRRFIYAQGVRIPDNFNTSFNGQTLLFDYPYANYVNNYNYPREDAKWEQASNTDNFSVDGKETLSPTAYKEPTILNTDYSNSEWLLDLYETNVASGESDTFMNLRPSSVVSGSGRSWSNNTGYIVLDNYNPTQNLQSCIYGVFKAKESSASEHILIKIEDRINGDYLKISVTGTTVSYLFKYQGLAVQTLATKTITTNVTFAVGVDIAKLVADNGNLKLFFANTSRLNIYIAGDITLASTFSGNVYKVGLCSSRNSSDILNLFDVGGSVSINTQTPTYSAPNITLSTSTPHGFSVGQRVTISGVTPSAYNGTWITKAGTTASTLVVDVGSNPGPITVGGNVTGTPGILSNSSTLSTLLSRTATYTLASNNLFSKIIPDIAVNSYWENYVPLSKLAKTVSDASGNDVYALDLIQFNFDYPEPKIYSGSNYDTSSSLVKTYVSFQTIISGANAAASTFTTTVSPNSNNVVNATTFSATTKYEVVNNMIIYPPTDVDITTLALVLHVESNIPGINTKPTNFRYLQLAAQSFNANEATPLGTRYAINTYPYTQSGTTFNYKSQNPYLIYKDSMPYLYLTKNSGFKLAGTYSGGTDRGIYINTNESLASDAKISSLQFAVLADFKEFPTSSMQILKLEGNGGSVSFSIASNNTAKTKGIITTSSEVKPIYYLNGKRVANPVINLNEWNMVGIVFPEPLNVSGILGKLKLTSTLLINNLSYYKANPVELQQKATQLLWSEIDDNNWGIPIPTQTPTISVREVTLTTTNSHRLFLSEKVAIRNLVPTEYNTTTDSYVTAIPSTTSFKYLATSAIAPSGAITTAGIALGTWEYSSIPNYFEIYSNNIKTIYEILTGTNKITFDSDNENQSFRLRKYEYLGYLNITFYEIPLDVR